MAKERFHTVTVEQRIQQVFQWNLVAYSRREIQQFAAEAGWGVEERQIDTYIAEAKKRLVERNQDTQAEDLSRILSLYWELYREAEPRDRPLILRDISKLKGLDQVNVNVKFDRPLKDVTDEELAAGLLGEKE